MRHHKLKSRRRHAEERIKQSEARRRLFCVQCSMNKDPATSITYNLQHRVTFPFLEVNELRSLRPCSNFFCRFDIFEKLMPFITPVLVILVHVLVWSDMAFCVTVGWWHQQFSGAQSVGWRVRKVLYLAHTWNVCHHVTEIRCDDVDGHSAKLHSLKPQIPSVVFFLLWCCDPTRVMASSFLRFVDHTQRRTTVGRTPLDEWSARRRDLYLTTYNTHNRQSSMPTVGFEPTISAGERPQTYALDRATTGNGFPHNYIT